MTMIKEDLDDEVKNGIKEEESDQTEFEEQLAKAKQLVDDLTEKKVNLQDAIASTNSEKDATNVEKGDNQKALEEEHEYLWSIKPDCTWMLNTFDERRKKRDLEIEGLQESKGMLQGAGAEELLQTAKAPQGFDDQAFGRLNIEGLPG